MNMSTNPQIIEHIVLFKIKPDTDQEKVSAMFDELNGLISLDQVVHLTAGPLLRTHFSSLTFTHMLHSRYNSKEDLKAYAVHPAHVSVVKESAPIVDDIMAVDWVVKHLAGPVALAPGSAIRVAISKLKESLGEKEKAQVLEVIGGIGNQFPSIDQFTFGENFSPDRAKGYSIASLAVLPGLSELDSNSELVKSHEEKARDLLGSTLALDYVIPI